MSKKQLEDSLKRNSKNGLLSDSRCSQLSTIKKEEVKKPNQQSVKSKNNKKDDADKINRMLDEEEKIKKNWRASSNSLQLP